MRQPILLLFALITLQSYAQTLLTKDVYKFKSRRYTFIPDSTIYRDSVDLNPFKLQAGQKQITIHIYGLEQSYRLDIKLTEVDTTALITAYTYEVKTVKPKRAEKRMFPKGKIDKKEEWNLKTKVTSISSPMIDTLLSIINSVRFDSLPTYRTMGSDLGITELDGYGFIFDIRLGDDLIRYSVGRLYLNNHRGLNGLKPIDAMLLNYLHNRGDLKVEYLNHACYNAGSSLWVCKR